MRSGNQHTDAKLTVPNVLTSLRIVMAIAAAACFAGGFAVREAVIVCIVAAALDAFDGWYARTFSQCSNLGKHLDPIADKLLMAVVYGLIAVKISSPVVWTLFGLIAFREIAMTAFRSYSLRRHRKFIPANRLGKVKMVAQSTVGLAVITYAYFWNGGFDISPLIIVPSLVGILAISYLSAAVYLRTWYLNTSTGIASIDVDVRRKYGETGRMVVGE